MRFGFCSALVVALAVCACSDPQPSLQGEGSTGATVREEAALIDGFVIENSGVIPIHSDALGRDYEIYVKTPPGYDKPENAGRRYPVLYLTDGPYTFQVASGLSRVPFSQERFHEFIIVGFSWEEGESPAISRRRDLTPWRDPQINGVTGGGEAYLGFLKQEAMPLIESRYRIDPASRTLGGQSYGGLFGLWTAFKEPDLFANYILTSPSIWFDDRQILKDEAAYSANHGDLHARIYLATGSREHPGSGGCRGCDNDMVADQARLIAVLKGRNYPGLRIKTTIVEDGFHETTFPVGLMQGMQWLYLKE